MGDLTLEQFLESGELWADGQMHWLPSNAARIEPYQLQRLLEFVEELPPSSDKDQALIAITCILEKTRWSNRDMEDIRFTNSLKIIIQMFIANEKKSVLFNSINGINTLNNIDNGYKRNTIKNNNSIHAQRNPKSAEKRQNVVWLKAMLAMATEAALETPTNETRQRVKDAEMAVNAARQAYANAVKAEAAEDEAAEDEAAPAKPLGAGKEKPSGAGKERRGGGKPKRTRKHRSKRHTKRNRK